MPDSSPLILNRVCRTPVVVPASAPAPNAAAVASERVHAGHDQHRGDRAAERDRSVRGDVGELEDPEADEHAQRQQRENEADGERADQQQHRSDFARATAQHAAARSARPSRRRG